MVRKATGSWASRRRYDAKRTELSGKRCLRCGRNNPGLNHVVCRPCRNQSAPAVRPARKQRVKQAVTSRKCDTCGNPHTGRYPTCARCWYAGKAMDKELANIIGP